jgi:hypothetical protein
LVVRLPLVVRITRIVMGLLLGNHVDLVLRRQGGWRLLLVPADTPHDAVDGESDNEDEDDAADDNACDLSGCEVTGAVVIVAVLVG